MSKISELSKLVKGYHVMSNRDADSLRDYWACNEAISRKRNPIERLRAAQIALKNYRVMISLQGERVRVFNPDLKREIIL